MLKGMIPAGDIFLLYKIYILLNFTFIQLITIKVWEIIVVSHLLETALKTILAIMMKVNRYF